MDQYPFFILLCNITVECCPSIGKKKTNPKTNYLCQSCLIPVGQITCFCSPTVFSPVDPLHLAQAQRVVMLLNWFSGESLCVSQMSNLWQSVCLSVYACLYRCLTLAVDCVMLLSSGVLPVVSLLTPL